MPSTGKKKLIVIAGPTAVGKTAVSIRLAKHFQAEIVSADSRQFFRELTIGTAKPDKRELLEVPHHFINSHSIKEEYDAARFGEEALACIHQLFTKDEYVILCGGSGLYIKALLEGFDDIPEVPPGIRENIIKKFNEEGLVWLQAQMQEHDPEYYAFIDQQNPHRLIRALEVKTATGMSISTFRKKSRRDLSFEVIKIGLDLPREVLYRRIDDRMDIMIQDGLFEEAEKFYPYRQHQALQTVGYREIFDFIDGLYDRVEAIRLLKRNTRHYAKRQLTWFRRDTEFRWFDPSQFDIIVKHIEQAG